MDELLDNEGIPKRIVKWDYIKVSITIMISLFGLSFLLRGLFYFVFPYQFYLGYLFFLTALILKFSNRRFYINILAIGFFLGCLNLVSWFPADIITIYIVSFNVKGIPVNIGIQFISCILFMIHLGFFHSEIELFKDRDIKVENLLAVKKFIVKFENKSSVELNEILNSKSYSKEAKEAAKSILENQR